MTLLDEAALKQERFAVLIQATWRGYYVKKGWGPKRALLLLQNQVRKGIDTIRYTELLEHMKGRLQEARRIVSAGEEDMRVDRMQWEVEERRFVVRAACKSMWGIAEDCRKEVEVEEGLASFSVQDMQARLGVMQEEYIVHKVFLKIEKVWKVYARGHEDISTKEKFARTRLEWRIATTVTPT